MEDSDSIAACGSIPIVGLMTMAALEGTQETARASFARLRETRDLLRRKTGLPLAGAFDGDVWRFRARHSGRGNLGAHRLGDFRRVAAVIAVAPHAAGAILPVLAHAGARRNAILGERAGSLRVAVTSPPEPRKSQRGDPDAAGGIAGGEARPDQPDFGGDGAAEAVFVRRDRAGGAVGAAGGGDTGIEFVVFGRMSTISYGGYLDVRPGSRSDGGGLNGQPGTRETGHALQRRGSRQDPPLRWAAGRIVELPGPLGPGGVQIYRVLVRAKPEPKYIELREDQLQLVPTKV